MSVLSYSIKLHTSSVPSLLAHCFCVSSPLSALLNIRKNVCWILEKKTKQLFQSIYKYLSIAASTASRGWTPLVEMFYFSVFFSASLLSCSFYPVDKLWFPSQLWFSLFRNMSITTQTVIASRRKLFRSLTGNKQTTLLSHTEILCLANRSLKFKCQNFLAFYES